MSLFSKKPKDPLFRYQDPTGEFDNRQLTRGLWFAKHREQLRKALIITAIIWCVLSVGGSVVLWIKYVSYDLWIDNAALIRQTQEFTNFTEVQEQYRALPLQFAPSQVFQSNSNRYDFVTPVKNDNERFLARVFYHYEYAGGETPAQTILLLPSSEAVLIALGQETGSGFPSQARLVIDDIRWKRINPHVIADIEQYTKDHLMIPMSDFVFQPEQIAQGLFHSEVSFTITNNTAYSYWEMPIQVVLFRGQNMVGVLYTLLPEFLSGEQRRIELFTPAPLSSVDSIELHPIINIFDPSVYIDVGTNI